MVKIATPTLKDIQHIYTHMRAVDVQEIAAMSGNSPRAAVLYAARYSEMVRAGYIDDIPVCLIGYGAHSIWMLATPDVTRAPVALMKQSRALILEGLQQYDYLVNAVDARNTVTLKWLKRLGFVIMDATLMGVANIPFHRIFITKGTIRHV